jgi:Major Facilitator Superfamily
MITGLAPVLAPLIGALLLLAGSWRLIFLAQAALAVVLLVASAFSLPETLPPSARIALSPGAALAAHRQLLANRSFAAFALVYGLAAGIIFAYIGGYAFLVEDSYRASPLTYALLFGANAAGMVVVAQLNGRRLIGRFRLTRLVHAGLAWSTLAAIMLTAGTILHAPLALVAGAMWFIIASRGTIMPNTTSLAMATSSGARGSAAGGRPVDDRRGGGAAGRDRRPHQSHVDGHRRAGLQRGRARSDDRAGPRPARLGLVRPGRRAGRRRDGLGPAPGRSPGYELLTRAVMPKMPMIWPVSSRRGIFVVETQVSGRPLWVSRSTFPVMGWPVRMICCSSWRAA